MIWTRKFESVKVYSWAPWEFEWTNHKIQMPNSCSLKKIDSRFFVHIFSIQRVQVFIHEYIWREKVFALLQALWNVYNACQTIFLEFNLTILLPKHAKIFCKRERSEEICFP